MNNNSPLSLPSSTSSFSFSSSTLSSSSSSSSTATLSNTEFIALETFYNATNGPFWIWHNISFQQTNSIPWNFSIPNVNPCEDNWQGLSCHCLLKKCEIIGIELDHHNLTGTITSSINTFTSLEIFILRGNHLYGVIPSSIGSLSNLMTLDLSYNNLTGFEATIADYSNLAQSLLSLDLSYNQMNGPLPSIIYELINLESLIICSSFITSLDVKIGNLTHLQSIQLQFNQLTTLPNNWELLKELQVLDLSNNLLDNLTEIPSTLFQLTQLQSFILSNSGLSFPIPESIGNLINLQFLDLSRNNLISSIPNSIGNLTSLNVLLLFEGFLTGTVPQSLLHLPDLYTLYLQQNQLFGEINFLLNLPEILFFDICDNLFSGSLMIANDQFKHCVYFLTYGNSFTGSLPWNGNWNRLLVYETLDNFFTGSLPSFYFNLTTTVYYVISQNQLSGEIPENFFINATDSLYFLSVGQNYLTGTIPKIISDFKTINLLNLSLNSLTGSLPESLIQLQKLAILDFSSNSFTGRITTSIDSFRFLEELFLQNNYFQGNLYELLNSTHGIKLVDVDISNNHFSGSLPGAFFRNATQVQSFAASSNCFSGSIPSDICHLPMLTSLSLDGLTTNCRVNLFPEIPEFNAFTVDHFIESTIPRCLYEMSTLELLHLSGNGISDSISGKFNFSSTLNELSLSHNLLTGTISNDIQYKSWIKLDLSYNKLTGTSNIFFISLFCSNLVLQGRFNPILLVFSIPNQVL